MRSMKNAGAGKATPCRTGLMPNTSSTRRSTKLINNTIIRLRLNMERSMKSREALPERTVAEPENEQAVRFLPGDQQFYADSCPRCTGLLVNECSYDLSSEGDHKANLLRCVQCGYRIDPVILQNRRRTTAENADIRETWHMYSVSTSMSAAAA
jgi:hypothetical protein